jgi:hypothetical protein
MAGTFYPADPIYCFKEGALKTRLFKKIFKVSVRFGLVLLIIVVSIPLLIKLFSLTSS